ncbi:MAG: hypothetical protein HYU02_01085 [Thaumarchaeota archaeon]|nr:hypothetical protein [Nitrososphaerota archaeon]
MEEGVEKRVPDLVINALLSEFQAVRSEIIETLKMQYTILSLGTGFVTALFAVALSQSANPIGIYLLLLIPFVSVAVSALWSVEGIRRLRAAAYIREQIARKINSVYLKNLSSVSIPDGRLLAYEHWFREEKSPELKKWNSYFYRLTQIGVLGIFLGAGLASWFLATYFIFVAPINLEPISAFSASIILASEVFAMGYVGLIVYRVIEGGRKLIPARENN